MPVLSPSSRPTPRYDFVEEAATPVPAGGPLYVIVPFGDPDDLNPLYRAATEGLAKDLGARDLRATVATPVDRIEAIGSAPRLCSDYRASGILVGDLTFDEQHRADLTGLIPWIGGLVSGSKVFDAAPIRARVRLYSVDCRGHVRWKTTTLANKVHHGQNVEAGLTQITLQAVAEASEEFRIRPDAVR